MKLKFESTVGYASDSYRSVAWKVTRRQDGNLEVELPSGRTILVGSLDLAVLRAQIGPK